MCGFFVFTAVVLAAPAIVKFHSDSYGARKKRSANHRQEPGGWTTKIHMVGASCRDTLAWSLTPGQAGDGPEGGQLIEAIGVQDAPVYLLMDSAYGGNDLRGAALECNLQPVVPAHPQRKLPWPLDKQRYRQCNGVERLFRQIEAYRRVFTRYDKLDVVYTACVSMALILEHLR